MSTKNEKLYVGIDVGSTTVKTVVMDHAGETIFGFYQRHNADVRKTIYEILEAIQVRIGDTPCSIAITGSGGLSLSKRANVLFVQEVVAVTTAVRELVSDADAVIELGGEDAKIIFLTNGIEQRMNGVCAGGTGAFIDQMAALIQTDAEGLNEYAKSAEELYPIAARCGVFAKTDIQPLINEGVSKANLAASIFQAVVNQTISGLACGRKIKGKVVFLGGPLFFLSELQKTFVKTLKLAPEDAIFPEKAHLFAARGAALKSKNAKPMLLKEVMAKMTRSADEQTEMTCLPALFETEGDYQEFMNRQSQYKLEKADLDTYQGRAFLGIDSGSTTLKVVLLSEDHKILYTYYGSNMGDPVSVVKNVLLDLLSKKNEETQIAYSCSTGYGEILMKNAFCLDEGEVETIAHYYAARYFDPEVDCILDIGGQDMKCIKIKDGSVDSIILNEACSSGCGSFIENFANSLGCTAEEFAAKALEAKRPLDLGTRCTVFMNSNVKQAQKEGAEVSDIAAGLAYSVIKNALFKVIKVTDAQALGKHVVVQGGTFYNNAVLRCFEIVSGRSAIRPEIAGLMGAFGAALLAKERYEKRLVEARVLASSTGTSLKTNLFSGSRMLGLKEIQDFAFHTQMMHCQGCNNHCRLTINQFSNGQNYISGNRCERGLQKDKELSDAPNMFTYKAERIFRYKPLEADQAPRGEIGMPRALNVYENYPFWATFFEKLGFRLVVSPYSSAQLYQLGMDSIPSESECYPAKLVHGHIEWLIANGVKRIFYPCVYYERMETEEAQNYYNCPMVTSYPENIKNNVESLQTEGVEFYDPFMSFSTEEIVKKRLGEYFSQTFSIPAKEVAEAVKVAWAEQLAFKADVLAEGKRILKWMEDNNRNGVVLAGRPYHLDPEVNHGIPQMVQGFGLAVLTEDAVADLNTNRTKLRTTNQWTYHARLYNAAAYVATRKDLELIQLNSFGCGVDAVTIDQVQELMEQAGKMYTLLKIDEVNNLGAAKIRVRSMIAVSKMRRDNLMIVEKPITDYERVLYTKDMHEGGYTILCTQMTHPHFDFFEASLQATGNKLVMMRNEGQNVLDMGLKYVNNDACYPAMIVTGQVMDAVLSGQYDTDKLAVMMVQTGGGCRASNYVAFIRKALSEAGYGHIPVISVSTNFMETNPGFRYTIKMGFKVLQSLIYGDVLMKVVHRMRPYEINKGDTDALYQKWHSIIIDDLLTDKINRKKFRRNCRQIIREFDRIPIYEDMKKPRVGIVGEVLVKYMPLANNHLAELLEAEGAEVVIPDFVEFMDYCFWNGIYRTDYLGASKAGSFVSKAAVKIFAVSRKPFMKELERSKHFHVPTNIEGIQKKAQRILQLGNQCGEGWFLPGEIIDLIEEGVPNVVCVQPFGCLPNHIVGKGIVKKVKELYPESNVVAVDYDPSASKVNQLNRIKLMLEVAKERLEIS